MNNAELITALRNCSSPTVGSCMDCPYYKGVSCKWQMMEDAADALEAAEKRIKELESQAAFFDAEKLNYQENIEYRDERIKELEASMSKRILGYDTEKLILFAMMCEKNDVREADLKQAAWNLELAVRAVMNERAEIVKNTMDKIAMSFTPDFEKAYEEMMQNNGARMQTVTNCHTLEDGER